MIPSHREHTGSSRQGGGSLMQKKSPPNCQHVHKDTLPWKLFLVTGIDVSGRSIASEELMRLSAITVATATVLTFAFPQISWVLAQGYDSGAVGRPLQLDGGPGSDNHVQGGRSEGTEQPAGVRSEKSQTRIGDTGETTIGGRSQTGIGSNSEPKHRVAIHRRGHRALAFNEPRHRFAMHRHGHPFVAFNGFRHRFVTHRHGRRIAAFNEPRGL